MTKPRYVLRQLWWLVAAVSVPLVSLLAFNLVESRRAGHERALETLQARADALAQFTADRLARGQRLLQTLADGPEAAGIAASPPGEGPSPRSCEAMLHRFEGLDPDHAAVAVLGLEGQVLCAPSRGAQALAGAAGRDWFTQGLAARGPRIGRLPSDAADRAMVMLTLPLPVPGLQQPAGLLALPVALDAPIAAWMQRTLPPHGSLSLLDEQARSLVVYTPERAGPDRSRVLSAAGRAGEAAGADGIERAFALAPVAGTGWQAMAAGPLDELLAGSRAQLLRTAIGTVAVVAALLLLATVLARRLARPLEQLAGVARSVACGDMQARADESAPGELGSLAAEFNRMVAARAQVTERYRLAASTGDIWDADFTTGESRISPQIKRHLGYTDEELPDRADAWVPLIHPDDRPGALQALSAHLREHRPFDIEYRVRRKDGRWVWMRSRGQASWNAQGRATYMAGTLIDISARKEAEERARRLSDFYAALSRTNGAIVRIVEPLSLYREICRICVELGHAHMAFVVMREGERYSTVAWAGPAPAFLEGVETSFDGSLPLGRGPISTALREGRHCIANDFLEDPATLEWREAAARIGTRATAAFPIRRGGRVVGAFSLHTQVPGFFDERLIGLLDEMAADLSFAVDNHDRETARREAVAQAQAGFERFSRIFHAAPVALALTTLDEGLLLDVNAAYCQLLGFTALELIGRSTVELGVWGDPRHRQRFMERLRREGRLRDAEITLHLRDGSLREILVNAEIMEFQGRTCMLTIASDFTERKRMEQTLRERELQLAGIVDTALDAIVTVDAALRVRVFNRAASELFMVEREAAIDQPFLRFVPPRLHERVEAQLRLIAGDGPDGLRLDETAGFCGLADDGRELPLEASISRLREGESTLLTVVMRDLSDQQRARGALQAQLAAEAASQAKTEFLSRMSHELRTPLNAVLGFAQLLQAGAGERLDERGQMQLEQIRQAGWHLLALINDVLDVSRIEAGAIQVESRAIGLATLLDEVIEMSRPQAQAHGVLLLLRGRETLAGRQAWGDPVRLRQVLLNLISNAVKYNRPGGHVWLEAGPRETQVALRVEDDGLGMTRVQLEHLYEPFNRLGRERGGVEGSGIGLVLTRQLVMLMRGTIEVDSEPGRGTRVTVVLPAPGGAVTLPATAPSASAAAPALPGPTAAAAAPRGAVGGGREPSGCVLYIEDNEVNRLVVEQLLARWPRVHLAQAGDGASGLALARSLHPDLVLLDMRLPDMDGTAVLRALRDDPATRDLPVVALSASAMPQEIETARRAGARDYWTKPLDFGHFLAAMEALLPGAEADV